MFVCLTPLFRFSPVREAWVLRLVGERFGPVLRPADWNERCRAPIDPRRPKEPWQVRVEWQIRFGRLTSRSAAGGVMVAGVLAAAVGFAVARGLGGSSSLTARASAGPLSISAPSSWRRRSAPQLGLRDALSVGPAAGGGRLLVGTTRAVSEPSLVPASIRASLAELGTAQVVTLGSYRFYMYASTPKPGVAVSETVYASRTTAGEIVAICSGPPSLQAGCQQSLGTVRLAGASPLPPAPSSSYATALNAVLVKLGRVSAPATSRLSAAPDAGALAKVLSQLASANLVAASSLGSLNPGSAVDANSAVVVALKRTGSAYAQLARAAGHHDNAAYRTAGAALTHARAELKAAFSQLGSLGYKLG